MDEWVGSLPVSLFYSYAHEDEALLNKLKAHLKPLQRQGLIDVWHDRDISAGTEWEREIDTHLNTAQIILLLISPDFMASNYCYSIEMARAMEQERALEQECSLVQPLNVSSEPRPHDRTFERRARYAEALFDGIDTTLTSPL